MHDSAAWLMADDITHWGLHKMADMTCTDDDSVHRCIYWYMRHQPAPGLNMSSVLGVVVSIVAADDLMYFTLIYSKAKYAIIISTLFLLIYMLTFLVGFGMGQENHGCTTNAPTSHRPDGTGPIRYQRVHVMKNTPARFSCCGLHLHLIGPTRRPAAPYGAWL